MIALSVFSWILVAALFAVLINIALAFPVAISGLRAKKFPKPLVSINKHQRSVKAFYTSLVPPVLLIEAAVSLKDRGRDPLLFNVHMLFIICFIVTSIAMYSFWTGKKDKNKHRPLSRFLLAVYLGIIGTGTLLVLDTLK